MAHTSTTTSEGHTHTDTHPKPRETQRPRGRGRQGEAPFVSPHNSLSLCFSPRRPAPRPAAPSAPRTPGRRAGARTMVPAGGKLLRVGPAAPRGAGWARGRPEARPAPRPRVLLRSVSAAPRRPSRRRARAARSFLSRSGLALVRLLVLGGRFFFLNSVSSVSSPGTLSGPQLSPLPQTPSALLPITFLFYSHDFVGGNA